MRAFTLFSCVHNTRIPILNEEQYNLCKSVTKSKKRCYKNVSAPRSYFDRVPHLSESSWQQFYTWLVLVKHSRISYLAVLARASPVAVSFFCRNMVETMLEHRLGVALCYFGAHPQSEHCRCEIVLMGATWNHLRCKGITAFELPKSRHPNDCKIVECL